MSNHKKSSNSLELKSLSVIPITEDYHYDINAGTTLKKPFKLLRHQFKTLEWMELKISTSSSNGISGALLKLDMGLGKTIISMSFTMRQKNKFNVLRKSLKKISKKMGITPDPEKGIVKIIKEYYTSDPAPRRDSEIPLKNYKVFCTLFVCSKTILTEISSEIKKFFGKNQLKYKIYHKELMDKDEYDNFSFQDIEELDMLIVTYDTIRTLAKKHSLQDSCVQRDARNRVEGTETKVFKNKITNKLSEMKGGKILFYYPFMNIFFDESHKFSNNKSDLFYSLLALNGKYKWCLTGTPLRNNVSDLFSQFKVMGYNSLINDKRFAEEYEDQKLYRNMLQVSYEDAGIKLPQIKRHEEFLELDDEEQDLYDYVFGYTKQAFIDFQQKKQQYANVLTLFLRCRQICIAAYTILGESSREFEETKDMTLSSYMIKKAPEEMRKWLKDKNGTSGVKSTKIKRIVEIVEKIVEKKEKVVIFSMFKRVLDLIIYAFNKRFNHLMIDGDVKTEKRDEIINKFKTNNKFQVMLIAYKAGSEGLNLAEICNNAILTENWWCPFVIEQAERRIFRYGQNKDVNVYKLIIKNSIEEKIEKVCKDKINMANQFMSNGKKLDSKSMRPTKEMMGNFLLGK